MTRTADSRRPRHYAAFLALFAALASVRAGRPAEADCAPFDFVAQLPQAAVVPETRFLDLGTREARPHLLTGWSIDELWHDKTSFVWAMGEASTLRFTRFSSEPLTLYFRCRPIDLDSSTPQEVMVLVNGAEVGQTRLDADFKTYQMPVPAAALRPGDNRMELRFAYFRVPPPVPKGTPELRRLAVAWDWIGFGTKSAPATPQPEALAPATPARALSLPFLTRVDYYMEIHPGSTLRWQAIRPLRNGRLAPDAAVEVRVDWDGLPDSRQERIEQRSFASPANITLPNQKTALARVSFLAWPGKSAKADTSGVVLTAPEIVPAGCPETGGGSSAAPGQPPPASGPNVVLYMIDTLRADHLGVYGYSRPVSPQIDAFAAQATVFDRAFAQSGWTKSSVTSMLTGLRPLTHGVVERMDTLSDAVRTLPEMLHDAGYETFGISTNPAVSVAAGLARGFDRFVELFGPEPALPFVAQPSESVNAELFRWLDHRDRARPFFAYLHAMDAHEPYLPPPAFRSRFAGQADAALCSPGPKDVAADLASHPGLSRGALSDNFAALYDAQIAHADNQFGLLLRRLRDAGLYDKTVIVLVSDHGEEFLDHGLFAHGHSLYQEILHVPLIVRWPGGQYAGRRIDSAVQHIDLLPTILAAARVPSPPAYPGLDLRLLAQMDTPVDREIASDLSLAGTRIASLVSGNMHLLVRDHPNPGAELYDLRRDPREQHNLAQSEGVRFGFLMTRLRLLHHDPTATALAERSPLPAELDGQLRSLGYV
jgi:arylsulfatase A-like enzyme